jgi:DNA (cytosine-5)-methyltransferase 1
MRPSEYQMELNLDQTSSPVGRPDFSASSGNDGPGFLEFFAGSGLVAHALGPYFRAVWANDISPKKAAVYVANHRPNVFHIGPIERVNPSDLPSSALAWASFPCQDLSLAGANAGIHGSRSGLVWKWLEIIEGVSTPPPILVAENVNGLITSKDGVNYHALHLAIRKCGYVLGAVILDAALWVPQSRPRVFIVAVREGLAIPGALLSNKPTWLQPPAVVRAAQGLEGWLWWRMPRPKHRKQALKDVIDWNADCQEGARSSRNLALIAPQHRARLLEEETIVAAGYKRTRAKGQVLELRFDNMAGCLRTPEGGSSRQFLVLKNGDDLRIRLLTVRETARLMGAPDSYKVPGTYNDGYKAMGDAVAVPVARFLARHILRPLSERLYAAN